MTLAAPSIALKSRRGVAIAIATVVALLAMAAFWGVSRWRMVASPTTVAGKYYAVAPIDFDVKVAKDGELAAVNNIDILNLVEGQSTIVQIVKEGAQVKKGDTLVELDASELRQRIEDAMLDQQKGEADLIVTRELRSIQESENAANLEAAEVDVELTTLALKQYLEGTYIQQLADFETAVKMADTTVKNKEEDLGQTKALYGKGFVTGSDVKQDELELIEAQNTQSSSKMKLKVLKEYSYPSDLAEKKSKLVQSEQAQERVRKRNASNLARVIADEKQSEQALVLKKRKLDHLNQQLALCVIKAPMDGLVVYAGDRNNQQGQIIEGAQVRERQQLLRLPDTSSMKAIVRINESQVPKLRVGQKATVRIVGVTDPVPATLSKISPLADSGSRWWNPDLKEYPVELTLDQTPVEIKPGIGVQAEIFTDRLSQVLAVPLAAIYADQTSSYVFTREADGDVKPVAVAIGETNETHARITTGLEKGANVLLLQAGQGRELLERAGISTSEPESRKKNADSKKEKPGSDATKVVATPGKAAGLAEAPAVAGDAAKPHKQRDKAPKPDAAPAGPTSATPPSGEAKTPGPVTRVDPGA